MMTTRTLLSVGAVLVICLAIFTSVSSSSSMSSTPERRNSAATPAAGRLKDRSTRAAHNEVTGKNSLLRSLMQPAGLPGTKLFSLLAPQGPGPETIATFAEDCTTPKTDFNFGETICAVVTNAPLGANERLVWGHTDGFLAREVFLNSSTQSDQLLLTPTSILGGETVNNRGTWRIRSINTDGEPVAETTFTIHDPEIVTGDLSVYKFIQSGESKVNENTDVSFTISVSNFGPDTASNVELEDFTPDATTFVSLTQTSGPAFTCTDSNCTIASLARGARANFVAVYHTNGVAVETFTTYSAIVSSDTAELRPADNSASGEFSIVVAGAPQACTLDCPDNINATANTTVNGERGAIVTFDAATPEGDCGSVTATPASGSFFPVGTTTVTVSATGGATCSFTVTVEDTGFDPPTISCPASADVDAGPNCEAVVAVGNPTTTGTNVTVVGTRSDGKSLYTCDANGENCTRKTTDDPFSAGITTITWIAYSHSSPGPFATAEDEEAARTGSATCTQVITVNDVTPPVISVSPQTIAADASCQALVPDFTTAAQVSDNCACSGSDTSEACADRHPITVTQSPAPGTPVGLGTHTITLAANDGSSSNGGAGNTTTITTTLTVVDNTAPVITLNGSASVTVECHTSFTDPGATASDACDASVPVTASGSVDVNTVGTYTIVYNASDDSGNNATAVTRTVHVVDTTKPVITITGADPLTVECHTSFTDPGATANDSCAGSVSVTSTNNVNVNVPGSYSVTYSATDASGNTQTATRTVNVVDTTQPTAAYNNLTIFFNNLTVVFGINTVTINGTSYPFNGVSFTHAGYTFTFNGQTISITKSGITQTFTLNGKTIVLWTPTHQYQTVNVSDLIAGAADSCDTGLNLNNVVISSVSSDEPENMSGGGDGNTVNDIVIAPDCKSVKLRAERNGLGNGRVYTITFRVRDSSNNVLTLTSKLKVMALSLNVVDDGAAAGYTVAGVCP